MARPKKDNADYFSHDADMRNDPRVKAVRNRFGLTGYSVWCMTLEILTDSAHFKREIDDLEAELLAADFGIDTDEFKAILDYMVKIKLLQKSGSCEFLSQKLCERLQSVTDKREKGRLRRHPVTESTQKKRNETILKETKEDVTDTPTQIQISEQLQNTIFSAFGGPASTNVMEWLKGHAEERIVQALAKAEASGKCNIPYVNAILAEWAQKGYPEGNEDGSDRSKSNLRAGAKSEPSKFEGLRERRLQQVRDRKLQEKGLQATGGIQDSEWDTECGGTGESGSGDATDIF